MRIARGLLCLVLLLLGTVPACTIHFEPFEVTVEVRDDKPSDGLPDPKQPNGEAPVPSGDDPVLNDDQQDRQAEAEYYIATVIYQGGHIVASYQLPSGDIIDFIARDSLPPLPYELPPLPFAPEDLVLPPGVELGLTELEQIPELLALAGTATPFHRPSFWPYILGETDAVSIDDYLKRYQLGGQPFSSELLYAGIYSTEPNRGVVGYMNQFRPDVAPDSLSLIEFAVACPAVGTPTEVIGVVISVDRANRFEGNAQPYADGEPRLHIEYARPDPITGQPVYQWDNRDGQFQTNPFRVHHPGQKVPFSVLGGTQVEHSAAIVQAPVTNDWWIVYNGDWLGYYPAGLFKLLNTGACMSATYGEVARWVDATTTGWAKTEMGSAKPPSAGLFNTAYVRDPKYLDFYGLGLDLAFYEMKPYQPSCYEVAEGNWGTYRFILLGGLGGKDPGCISP